MKISAVCSLFFFSMLSVCAFRAGAQTGDSHAESIHIGISVSYSPLSIPGDVYGRFGTPGFMNFSVPLQFGPNIRFNPELGLYFNSYQEQVPDSSGGFLRTSNQQIVRTGFSVLYTVQVDSVFQFGIGPRIGIMSSETESHQNNTQIQDTDAHYAIFYLGGVFGVEYYFSHHFSISGELQFMDYSYGSPLITVGSNPLSGYRSDTPTEDIFATQEVLTAIFWF